MTPLKSLRALLRNWVEDNTIDDVFQNFINFAIRECETITNFSELYGEKTLTLDGGVFTEPARCREITDVIPYTETGYPAFRFEFRTKDPSRQDGGLLMYSINPYEGLDTEEKEVLCTYAQGGVTLTQADTVFFDANDIGKRIMIDEDEEVYELLTVAGTAPNQTATVYPPLASEPAVSPIARVNPPGTKRYILKAKNNVPYEGQVTVRYQKKHPIVWKDSSLLLIPCPQSVALLALQQALTTNKYDVDAERLQSAVMMAKNRELDSHDFKTTKAPRVDAMFSVRSRR